MAGRINYPYTTKYVKGKLDDKMHGINFKKSSNEYLNRLLVMYARLGLLSETPVIDDKGRRWFLSI